MLFTVLVKQLMLLLASEVSDRDCFRYEQAPTFAALRDLNVPEDSIVEAGAIVESTHTEVLCR